MPEFCKTGMEYRLNFDEEKAFINADPNLIVRLFDNLVSNAIKYGKPIPTEDLPNVFEKYYIVDYSKNSGAGLGLAISKSIVELFSGKISVHSSGCKTIFEMRFIAEGNTEDL